MANPIVFSAYKTHGGIAAGNYIGDYDKFLTSYGNTFDLASGIFTAPRGGSFEFFAAMYQDNNNANSIQVQKNDAAEIEFYSSYHDSDTVSFNWIMVLKEGDTVRMKVNNGDFYCGSYYGCIFNGKFIRQS